MSFISGIIVCSIILFGLMILIPMRADTDNSGANSENFSQSLLNLLPDFEKIYRESLAMPFRKAESKIYDEDIARFYRELLSNSVLSEPENKAK
ncbi:MAG: hypothetical protein A2144_00895 [Chloroflexi bacterium RBG_16_50_9]|nr:MAG: hypothetical protein A2144_00895 [Chloroflexi bacterium RBG_16_50_9]